VALRRHRTQHLERCEPRSAPIPCWGSLARGGRTSTREGRDRSGECTPGRLIRDHCRASAVARRLEPSGRSKSNRSEAASAERAPNVGERHAAEAKDASDHRHEPTSFTRHGDTGLDHRGEPRVLAGMRAPRERRWTRKSRSAGKPAGDEASSVRAETLRWDEQSLVTRPRTPRLAESAVKREATARCGNTERSVPGRMGARLENEIVGC
jgi:hypothetical protein